MEGQDLNSSSELDVDQQNSTPVENEIFNKEEESKLSDQFAGMNIKDKPTKEENPVSQKESIGNPYVMVHHTKKNWQFVVDTLKPVQGRGKIEINTMLGCIQTFIKKFEGNGGKNVDTLKSYFSSLNNSKKSQFETRVFPTIVSLLLETPKLFPEDLPLLVQWRSQKIKLSKRQCACLLSHMFMCTTLQQKSQKLPNMFSFSEIFDKEGFCSDVKIAKIACVMNYFTRISTEIRPTYVVFERLVLNEVHGSCTLDAWRECNDPVGRAEIRPQGKIEDAEGAIEIDFANKFIGGGVMRNGAAQEEIQFATSPELLISVLFFEVMAEKEAIFMKGSEIYCASKGYLNKFRFDYDHRDEITATINDILERDIVAIDAINFKNPNAPPQFSDDAVLRELNKAYIGFYGSENKKDKTVNKPISTGKWGCGVFKGDTQLKFIIQWLACSRAYRDMIFYSFGDNKEFKDAEAVLDYYKDKKVGELVEDLLKCCEELEKSDKQKPEVFRALIELKSIKNAD